MNNPPMYASSPESSFERHEKVLRKQTDETGASGSIERKKTSNQSRNGPLLNHRWTREYEKILKEWKARLFVSMWLQTSSSYFFMWINDILTYPVIVVSSVSSATLFSSSNNVARLIIAIFSIISVIITSMLIELRPGERQEQYMSTSRKYTTLIRNIDYCLAIPPHMREDPELFIDKVNIEMDNIIDQEDIAPIMVIRKFEKKFGNLDKLLYGEEIVDLIMEDIKTMKIANKIFTSCPSLERLKSETMPTVGLQLLTPAHLDIRDSERISPNTFMR